MGAGGKRRLRAPAFGDGRRTRPPVLAADGSEEREQWCLDNWDAVAASVAAAQNISLGMAAHQLLIADALRHRLPRVAEVFTAGAISYRLIAAVVSRTRLIKDSDALAKVDTEIAAHVTAWGSLSVDKTQHEIDYWVDRYDPAAVRRTEDRARGRLVDVHTPEDGAGTADIEARLFATDAEALDQRLDAMARAVCEDDPRTLEQRRADALGALGHGADRWPAAAVTPTVPPPGASPALSSCTSSPTRSRCPMTPPPSWTGRKHPAPTRQASCGR